MSLLIASLNSGSNGNCYYIGNEREAVLVDAGISCRETEKRMHRLGLSMLKVKAIFISHEHSDHIKGVEGISKKYNIPVYITTDTLQNCHFTIPEALIKNFKAYRPLIIGGLEINAFPKLHDACQPHSFTIACKGIKIGVFTDIGRSCDHVKQNFKQCHAAFLEANYDEQLLQNGNYPYHLKNRITSGFGHLSNTQALELFLRHKPVFMSHLLLSHLSKDNNSPELVNELFKKYAGPVNIIVASRYQETELYQINANQKPAFWSVQMELSFNFA